MRNPYLLIFSRFRSFLLFLLGVFALHFSARSQCYPDIYVYQINPYGTVCGAQNVTLQADYYDPYGSGEFRWYTNEYDYYPVYTEPYSYYFGTSYYTFWVSDQTTVWVSYYDYTTNCESYRVPYTVEVSSPPQDGNIYASSTTICLGQSVTISSDGGNGWPHFWCSNDGGQTWSIFSDEHVGEYSFQHTPTATGTYRYHLRNSTDCGFCGDQPGGCPSYVYVDVTVVAPPAVSITTSTPSYGQGEIKLTASLTTASYQWQYNNVDIPGAISITRTAGSTGNYQVKAISSTGCVSTSSPVAVTVSNTNNYVITNTIRIAGITTNEQVNTLTSGLQQSVSYQDGLGRPVQEVMVKGSASGKDVISFSLLDDLSRENKKYLPYTDGTDGSYKTSPLTTQSSFYGGQPAFAETKFDDSPLDRVSLQGEPGTNWQLSPTPVHAISMNYLTNSANEIRLWNYNPGTKTAEGTTFYSAGELQVTQKADEHGKFSFTYTDKRGLLICDKSEQTLHGVTSYIYSYNVYDQEGNLIFRITPEGVKALSTVNYSVTYNDAFCKRWVFANQYDAQMRLVEKIVPGAGITYYVYDPLNRVVMSQDEKHRPANQWLFTKFDALDRAIISGMYTHSTTVAQADMQTVVNNYYGGGATYYEKRSNTSFSSNLGYTNQAFPSSGIQAYQVTYYDDYDFDYNGTEGEINKGEPLFVDLGSPYSSFPGPARGKSTGALTLVLGTSTWLTTATYYDDQGRIIETLSENYNTATTVPPGKGRSEEVAGTQYDFEGTIITTIYRHCNIISDNSYKMTMLERPEYDHTGRTTAKYVKVGNATEKLVASYTYDELGQLKSKSLGTSPVTSQPLEILNYNYNIRGWLTTINKDFLQDGTNPLNTNWFGLELAYDQSISEIPSSTYAHQRYNGSIAGTSWRTRGSGVNRKYDFSYDNFNQLLAANFNQQFGSVWDKTDPNNSSFSIDYSVGGKGYLGSDIEYDDNGNIRTLWQKGLKVGSSPKIDDLDYSYNGNQLTTVTDAANDPSTKLSDFHDGVNAGLDYDYDLNGNLTVDHNKGISGIIYNHLNLPELITITGKGTIQYIYDAGGGKLEKVVTDNTVTPAKVTSYKYIGHFIYINDALQHAAHEEGRIRWTEQPVFGGSPGTFFFDYYIKDHLGNVRMILTEQQQVFTYMPATMEDVSDKNNVNDPANYIPFYTRTDYTVDPNVRFPIQNIPNYPSNAALAPNDYVAKVNGSGNKIGPGVALKVMSGDKFNLSVSSWYRLNGVTPQAPGSSLIPDIIGALSEGVAGKGKFGVSELTGSGILSPGVTAFFNGQGNDPAKPKAYLNWILLDDQFNFVESGSGADQVGADQVLKTHAISNVSVRRNGYLYVYVSNETPNVDVYFDNLQITHTRGPLLEESHYYPLGLEMAGISSHILDGTYAINKFKFQGQEFESALDLMMNEFEARFYDPQLGRWHVPDPAEQFASPYSAMGNNWTKYTDPDGRILPAVIIVGALIGGAINVATHWSQITAGGGFNLGAFASAFGVGAVAGAVGAATGGAALAASGVAGGVAGGAIAGVAGSAFASPILAIGNGAAFGDSYSLGQFAVDVVMGGIGGGIVGGTVSALKGQRIWDGSAKVPPRVLKPVHVDAVPEKINVGEIRTDKALGNVGNTPTQSLQQNTNFNKSNYRANLIKTTGINPGSNAHAHHDIPQFLRERMAGFGINVDDPKYLRWWQVSTHQGNARNFNDAWRTFLQEVRNPTKIQVHQFVQYMRQRYPSGITGY